MVSDSSLPSGYGLIVRRQPRQGKDTWNAAQFRWYLRAARELTFAKPHTAQYLLLEKRGVTVPGGPWVALSDPFTADPKLFRRPGNRRKFDKVLQIIQVTAAIALEIAVSKDHMPKRRTAAKISRELAQEGLPGDGKRYDDSTVEKWHRLCVRGSHELAPLFKDGLEIFRGITWSDVLRVACVEAFLRAALHKLHDHDANGSRARRWFYEYVKQLRQEHDRVQRGHFFPEDSR
jgi:hypothetical protein